MNCLSGLFLSMRTVTESNTGGYWLKKSKRAESQRTVVCMAMLGMIRRDRLALPMRIQFTRYGPKTLDSDNIFSAFKHVRDGVADAFGVDDKSDLYEWPAPLQVKSKHYGIRIELEAVKVRTV